MWLFAGLGNPGSQYENNRHNIGFMAVDSLVQQYAISPKPQSKFNSQLWEGKINEEKILFLKPQTYMNNSGEAIAAVARFYKIPLSNIIVFHDELDLVAGKIRTKQGGGAAGHNGIKSIDSHLGKDYWRVRMGIGHPGQKEKVHSYVLSDFTKDEMAWVQMMCQSCAKHADHFVKKDFNCAMSKVTLDLQKLIENIKP